MIPDSRRHTLECCDAFQEAVSEYLIRHRSILDVVSKLQEASARVNRAVAKAVTSCGCIEIDASKQRIPSNTTYTEMKELMATHLQGTLCENCQDVLESELGRSLFYIVALCNLFDIQLEDVLEKERERISTLGVFNLT